MTLLEKLVALLECPVISGEVVEVEGIDLREMQIEFLPVTTSGEKDFSGIGDGEVVILPAFGASVQEMARLESKHSQIVDTTCPWVSPAGLSGFSGGTFSMTVT